VLEQPFFIFRGPYSQTAGAGDGRPPSQLKLGR